MEVHPHHVLDHVPQQCELLHLHVFYMAILTSGNVAVVRAYVSGATTMKERTPAMANLSAGQAIGFIIGPGIQAAFYPIGYPGIVHIPELHIDLYTAPALFSAVLGVVNIGLILTIFSEHKVQDDDIGGGSIQYSSDTEDLLTEADVDKPDTVAVVASNITFFVVLFVFSLFETISTPVSMDMYDWTKSQATLYNGIILACAGILAVIVFMAIKVVTKKINERAILLGGFIFILAGFIVYLPWGNIYPDYQLTKLVPAIMNNTNQSSTVGPLIINGTDVTPVGCPTSQAWCAYIPKISFAQNIVGSLCVAIGYPTCNVMSYTIYSKILGPTPQGTMMGWFTASGSLARMVGPIFISYFYSHFGPRVSFVTVCAIVLMTILGVIVVYKRLVPFRITRKPLRSYTTN
ncbi:unnamed protein product [Owenia fusiformis]|uniref:Major facilitator superfamily (MFS) profile domain-containing protein n=1 Tax=Owenia fusiformis TaxID=6347 RepID=A0A8S4N7U1_OWEFU|nr:unnamed protein product [Owenia fusiformis]